MLISCWGDQTQLSSGVSGIFMETHPDPEHALSDGPNAWPLGRMEALLDTLVSIDRAVKARTLDELTIDEEAPRRRA